MCIWHLLKDIRVLGYIDITDTNIRTHGTANFPPLSSQPILEEKLKIQDTCGVHNLHGMPGVLGAIVGAVTAALATKDVYGDGLVCLFFDKLGKCALSCFYGEAPPFAQQTDAVKACIHTTVSFNTPCSLCCRMADVFPDIHSGEVEASFQGVRQAISLAVTLGIALLGGLITGM